MNKENIKQTIDLLKKSISILEKEITRSNTEDDYRQFDRIAELVEEELLYCHLPKDLRRFDVLHVIHTEIESVGIVPGSQEESDFIIFLEKRWGNDGVNFNPSRNLKFRGD